MSLSHKKQAGILREPDVDDLTPIVGKNLRRLRIQRGLSLERLAHISGVSRAMLSHIELGQSTPTINTLSKISRALNVPFGLLIHSHASKPAFVLKANESEVETAADGKVKIRSVFLPNSPWQRNIEIYELQFNNKAQLLSKPNSPGTVENFIVNHGTLEVKVGNETHELSHGDSLFLKGDVPHVYINRQNAEAKAYKVIIYENV